MNQADVLNVLLENGPMTTGEIQTALGCGNTSTVQSKLARLRRWGDVEVCGFAVNGINSDVPVYRAVVR